MKGPRNFVVLSFRERLILEYRDRRGFSRAKVARITGMSYSRARWIEEMARGKLATIAAAEKWNAQVQP